MAELYQRIGESAPRGRHLMPLSLRMIKTLGEANIDWRGLHVVDVCSMVCAVHIDRAREYLLAKQQEKMQKAGVRRITPATAADFDAL